MKKLFKNYSSFPLGVDISALILRLTLGLSMVIGHGWGKWGKLFGDDPIKFADPLGVGPEISLGLAVFAEVICSALLTIGLVTRWSLVPLIITMATALFIIHGADDFSGKEKALIYLMGYLALFFTGPGKFSVDAFLHKKESQSIPN